MENELYHYGIKGQKWGVRRYQNPDGTLTPAGKKRAEKLRKRYEDLTGRNVEDVIAKNVSANIETMSDQDLNSWIIRRQKEKTAYELRNSISRLNPKTVSKGQSFVKKMWNKVVEPAATDAGKEVLTNWLKKIGKDKLGLIKPKSEVEQWSDTLAISNAKRKVAENNAWFKKHSITP